MEPKRYVLTACMLLTWSCMAHAQNQAQRTEQANRDATVADEASTAKPARTFEKAAVAAVKQWEFAPGGGHGKVRLDFTL